MKKIYNKEHILKKQELIKEISTSSLFTKSNIEFPDLNLVRSQYNINNTPYYIRFSSPYKYDPQNFFIHILFGKEISLNTSIVIPFYTIINSLPKPTQDIFVRYINIL